jgi:hypothetical protein
LLGSSGGGTAKVTACVADKKNTNAVGLLGNSNFNITKFPYILKSCDQVILIEGATTFLVPDDYMNKEPRTYTMSAYAVNQFKTISPMILQTQLLLDDMASMPVEIPGAPRCLKFQGSEKDIIMCLNQNQKASQLLKAYADFMKCRMGGNLADGSDKQPLKLFKEFQKACLKRKSDSGRDLSEEEYLKKLNSGLPSILNRNKFAKMSFNSAFGYKTPGSE